jgi:hypothetical protein
MKPIDIRNANYAQISGCLSGMRERVYWAWMQHGQGTTEQLAQRSGIPLLTARPRTTELVQLGLVELVGQDGHDGLYRGVDLATVAARTTRERQPAVQLGLRL